MQDTSVLMTVDSDRQKQHNDSIDALALRLTQHSIGNAIIAEEVPLRGPDGSVVYVMDVCRVQTKNGKTYVTAYEVKTTNGKARHRAMHQATVFYSSMMHCLTVVPNFVYINTFTHDTERWTERYVLTRRCQ